MDAKDRELVAAELEKYPHPLEDERPHLYNPVTGQIAPASVNVTYSISIGGEMEKRYVDSLPHGFYNTISSPIKTMSLLKKQIKGKSKTIVDLENVFLRLLVIGQRRQMELEPIFAYELCSVPSSLIDVHDCPRKGNKSGLVKRLGVPKALPSPADTVIVDVSQLFYHIVWPHGGKHSDLITSIQVRLKKYSTETEKIVVFDKYNGISAKDDQILRQAGDIVIDYELSIVNP